MSRTTDLIRPRGFAAARVVLLLSLGVGCSGDSLTPDPCTGPSTIVSPLSVAFAVGDTVLADIELVGPVQCRPDMLTKRQIRWLADDSTIARVSPNKGVVVGKSVGETTIRAYYPADGSHWGAIPVTVGP